MKRKIDRGRSFYEVVMRFKVNKVYYVRANNPNHAKNMAKDCVQFDVKRYKMQDLKILKVKVY